VRIKDDLIWASGQGIIGGTKVTAWCCELGLRVTFDGITKTIYIGMSDGNFKANLNDLKTYAIGDAQVILTAINPAGIDPTGSKE
jgi:hypothetical protein